MSSELVESVRVHGILQPILVRRRTQGYEVVVGARRLVAARLAGLKEIPAVVIQATDEEVLELSNIENTCRENASLVSPTTALVEPVKAVAQTRRWSPAIIMEVCGVGILLVVLGSVAGFWFEHVSNNQSDRLRVPVQAAVAPEPVVIPAPVVVEPRVDPSALKLEVSEIKALEGSGLRLLMESNGMARIIFDAPLFSSRAALTDEGTELLNKLGAVFIKHGGAWEVVVTGHTDAIPLRGNGLYRDNKELGLARALEVVRYLMREAKVPATMLRAATAGEDTPPYPGDDVDSRRKNRTVSLQVKLL